MPSKTRFPITSLVLILEVVPLSGVLPSSETLANAPNAVRDVPDAAITKFSFKEPVEDVLSKTTAPETSPISCPPARNTLLLIALPSPWPNAAPVTFAIVPTLRKITIFFSAFFAPDTADIPPVISPLNISIPFSFAVALFGPASE